MFILIGNDRVKLEIIEGADHHFVDKLGEFIDLPNKYLL